MRTPLPIAALVLAMGLPCAAQKLKAPHDPGVPPARAAERIIHTGVFNFGGVGRAGATSEGEKDFRRIAALDPAQAIPIFERMYADGNPQAKAYALAGLRKFEPTRANALRDELRNTTVYVETMQGCIVSRESLSEIADQIAAGQYDSWLKRASP